MFRLEDENFIFSIGTPQIKTFSNVNSYNDLD